MKDRGRPQEQPDRTLLDPLSSEELKALREARRKMQERRRATKKQEPGAHRIVLGPEPEEAGLGDAPTRAMPALPSFEGNDDSLLQLRTDRPAVPPGRRLSSAARDQLLSSPADQTLSDRGPLVDTDVVQPQPMDEPRALPPPERVEPSEAPTPVPGPVAAQPTPPPVSETPPTPARARSWSTPAPRPAPAAADAPAFGADTMMWMQAKPPSTASTSEDAAPPPALVDPAPAPKRSWLALGLVLILLLLLGAAAAGFMLQSRPRGILVLRTEPAGAKLNIDGQPYEERTPLKIDLPEGEHELLVQMNGHQPQRIKVQVQGGQDLSRVVTLRPTSRPGLMSVRLKLRPLAARVSVDGKAHDPTTLLQVPDLDPKGAHQFVISAPGYFSQTLEVGPGELKPDYEVELKKDLGPSADEAPAEAAH